MGLAILHCARVLVGESTCKEHKDKAESPVQQCFFVLDDCWSNEYFYLKGSTEVSPNINFCVAVFRPSLPKSVHTEVMQTPCHQRGENYNVGNGKIYHGGGC